MNAKGIAINKMRLASIVLDASLKNPFDCGNEDLGNVLATCLGLLHEAADLLADGRKATTLTASAEDMSKAGTDNDTDGPLKHFDGITATKLSQEVIVDYSQVTEWCKAHGVSKFGRGYKLTHEEAAAFRKDYGL